MEDILIRFVHWLPEPKLVFIMLAALAGAAVIYGLGMSVAFGIVKAVEGINHLCHVGFLVRRKQYTWQQARTYVNQLVRATREESEWK